MIKRYDSRGLRERRHRRIRARLSGTTERPRVAVFRSTVHIYAQIIDDLTGRTLVQASSLDKDVANIEPALPKVVAAPVAVAKEEVTAKVDKGGKAGAEKGGKPGAEKGGKQPAKAEAKAEAKPAAPAKAGKKTRLAQQVGTLLAQRAQEKGIKQVVFDRGGFFYHGRIRALAESARAAGLEF
jgi:large subunit ribosomal protein L18